MARPGGVGVVKQSRVSHHPTLLPSVGTLAGMQGPTPPLVTAFLPVRASASQTGTLLGKPGARGPSVQSAEH